MLPKLHFHARVIFIFLQRRIVIHLVELFLAPREGKLEAWAGFGRLAVPALSVSNLSKYVTEF